MSLCRWLHINSAFFPFCNLSRFYLEITQFRGNAPVPMVAYKFGFFPYCNLCRFYLEITQFKGNAPVHMAAYKFGFLPIFRSSFIAVLEFERVSSTLWKYPVEIFFKLKIKKKIG